MESHYIVLRYIPQIKIQMEHHVPVIQSQTPDSG